MEIHLKNIVPVDELRPVLQAQARKDGFRFVTLLGEFRHPDHWDRAEYILRVYDFGGVRVAESNGDPLWEESYPEEFDETLAEYEANDLR